jgi:hypothetical protein
MTLSANRRWTLRGLAVPLLLSLLLHGSLLLVMWVCPMRSRSPALSIESTRITVEACALDLRPADSPRERELLGPHVAPDFNPQLEEAPAVSPETLAAGPTLSPGDPLAPKAGSLIPPVEGGPSGAGNGVTGSLFPLPATASSVVYVLDRSVSMGVNNKLDAACQELLASLRRLPPTTRFQIITYNTSAETLIIDRRIDLLPPEPAILAQVARFLDTLTATGKTNHANALRRGLLLHPEVLYFVTDADDLKLEEVANITNCNRGTAIHTLELTRRPTPLPDSPLAELARNNHGTYRHVAVGD